MGNRCVYPRSTKDLINKLERQQQPYVSIKIIFLPRHLKDQKKILTLPKLGIKDEFRLNEPTEASPIIKYKEDPTGRGLKPDFMYAGLIILLECCAFYIKYPACPLSFCIS